MFPSSSLSLSHLIFLSNYSLQVSADLLLQLLNVSQELLTAGLKEEVTVSEPSTVSQTHQLEELWEQRDAVEGTDDGGGEPDGDESSRCVDNDAGLVLDLVPLQLCVDREVGVGLGF